MEGHQRILALPSQVVLVEIFIPTNVIDSPSALSLEMSILSLCLSYTRKWIFLNPAIRL
jgi:hypothetical protein